MRWPSLKEAAGEIFCLLCLLSLEGNGGLDAATKPCLFTCITLGRLFSLVISRTFRVLSYARREAAAAMKCCYLGNSAHRQSSHDERT